MSENVVRSIDPIFISYEEVTNALSGLSTERRVAVLVAVALSLGEEEALIRKLRQAMPERAARAAVLSLRRPPSPLSLGKRRDCSICHRTFRSSHGLAIHSAKAHRIRRGHSHVG